MSEPEEAMDAGQALVVCSAEDTLKQVTRLLDAEGYGSCRCGSADEIAALLDECQPAVIVVDADHEPRQPLEACRTIREIPGCDFVPLLLLTADTDSEATRRAYDANVTTVVAKPLDDDVFRGHLNSLGDTGRTLSGIRALRMPESDVLRGMPDALFIVGQDGLLRQYLGGACDDSLLQPGDIEGRLVKHVWPVDVATQVMQSIKRVLRTRDSHALEFELADDYDRSRYEMRLLVQGRDRVLMIIRNTTVAPADFADPGERGAADTLTGLTTHDLFMQNFDAVIADARLRERGLAVFCIDIDRFTRINETLGRSVGDEVLKVAAQRIERCLRSHDKLARLEDPDSHSLTRISGDEFVLVLQNIEAREDVDSVASRVRDAFNEPVSIDGHQLDITPSIGMATFPLDGGSADELLKNARVALDEAKTSSIDGREFYSNTMKFRALKRFDVKNELRWALEKDQLELRYLPRIDLQTGHVAGLEALLRWMHPLRGSVPLSEVIPLAEATGLIYPIGEWVLQSACQQANEWFIDDINVPPVSINLSQQEFMRDDLATLISRALEETGLPAEHLEVELTEPMLMRNRQADAVVRRLTDIGIGVVLDDFGRGRSSIAHLTTLPLKAIKIDRSFIDGVREPGEQQAICSAIIAMSRELGIAVIAEGVESELQAQFLKERGCDAVQGFLYTEPLPAAEVPAFLDACQEVVDEATVIDLDTVRIQIAAKTAS